MWMDHGGNGKTKGRKEKQPNEDDESRSSYPHPMPPQFPHAGWPVVWFSADGPFG